MFVGSATAMVTPFKNGEIDYESFGKNIDFQINNGTAALIICGTTGEPSTMSTEEQKNLVEFAVNRVDGYVPIIAGTGGNNTAEVIKKAKIFKKIGADAQLCVTPYYNKTTQDGLVAHYTAIADNTELPVVMYNVPGRTGLNMLPETVAKLADHENIVAHKEACADMVQASEMMRLIGDKITIYSGMDELTYPLMCLGGKGVISVVSNLLPAEMSSLALNYLDGNAKEALNMQLKLFPIIKAIFKQTSPTPIKAAMAMKGMCSAEVRLPLIQLSNEELAALKKIVDSLGV
ncbi:MAG: 4-hydroxy-tetrahydrodipicolinate synthase [Christensenellaceae bacterium]|nr:4-hydroxy-tetrahydrodipicolinate synthase [Christensenellaceae bacterium]